MGQCDAGLHCKVTWHGTFSTNVCEEQQVPRGHTGEQCNLLGSGQPLCLDENDYCKTVHLLPSGTTQVCTRQTAQVGERCGDYARQVGRPTECDEGLTCQSHRMYPSGTAQICEKPTHEGGVNEPCRSNVFAPATGAWSATTLRPTAPPASTGSETTARPPPPPVLGLAKYATGQPTTFDHRGTMRQPPKSLGPA